MAYPKKECDKRNGGQTSGGLWSKPKPGDSGEKQEEEEANKIIDISRLMGDPRLYMK